METLTITSPAFNAGDFIPKKYTCQGDDVNPEINISGIPADTKSLALIVDDPDAPNGLWVHWVVWNIPITNQIQQNSIPGEQGVNDFRRNTWGGPCPPSGTHRYFFKIYALDTTFKLPPGTTKSQLEHALRDHILARGELMGRYRKA
jgi:Raf kinase inhibitor-like YbhB/YbcL family protein